MHKQATGATVQQSCNTAQYQIIVVQTLPSAFFSAHYQEVD